MATVPSTAALPFCPLGQHVIPFHFMTAWPLNTLWQHGHTRLHARRFCIWTAVTAVGHISLSGARQVQERPLVLWFLPHSDARHDVYPLHYTREEEILAELREQHPWTGIGFLVGLEGRVSYGAVTDFLYC